MNDLASRIEALITLHDLRALNRYTAMGESPEQQRVTLVRAIDDLIQTVYSTLKDKQQAVEALLTLRHRDLLDEQSAGEVLRAMIGRIDTLRELYEVTDFDDSISAFRSVVNDMVCTRREQIVDPKLNNVPWAQPLSQIDSADSHTAVMRMRPSPEDLELISSLSWLKSLDLWFGATLVCLPESFTNLAAHLTDLSLKHYQHELPDYIGDFAELRFLELTDCRISRLPPEIVRCKKLEALGLYEMGNIWESFSEEIKHWIRHQEIEIKVL